MKIKVILTAGLMLVNVGLAHADSSVDAVANAGASAVVNNSPTTTSNSSSTSGVTLESGAVSNTANGGSASAQNGDMTTTVHTGDTNINFAAANVPPPAAPVLSVAGSVPQIFGSLDGTANGKGIDLTLFYAQVCHSKTVRGYRLVSRSYGGASGKTEIVFSPHLNYAKATRKTSPDAWDAQVSNTISDVEEVETMFGKSGHFKCLGMMTITAKDKKAGSAPLSTILLDAEDFPIQELEGFQKVTLLSTYDVIAATKGTDNSGSGLGVGAGLSRFFDPLLGTLGGSASTSSGVTYPETKIGVTFLVLVEDPDGVFIDLSPKKPEPTLASKPEARVPVVVESKAGAPQEIVTTPAQKPKPKKRKIAKKAVVVPKKADAPTVIECKGCVINGTITLPAKKAPGPVAMIEPAFGRRVIGTVMDFASAIRG